MDFGELLPPTRNAPAPPSSAIATGISARRPEPPPLSFDSTDFASTSSSFAFFRFASFCALTKGMLMKMPEPVRSFSRRATFDSHAATSFVACSICCSLVPVSGFC